MIATIRGVRAFWTGNLVIGHVSIPVGLASTKAGDPGGLVRLHRDCGARVAPRNWCQVDERIVEDNEVVKAFEVAPGQHVTIEDDELAALEPRDTRTITVLATISRGKLDELQVDTTYYLTPAKTPVGRRPYELFRQVLADHPGTGLLCTAVVRKHEWACLVRAHPTRRVLLLEKLVPEAQLVPCGELEGQLDGITVSEQERQLAHEVVAKRTRARLPKRALDNGQRDRLVELVNRKLEGQPIVLAPQPAGELAPMPATDLAAALRRSLTSAKPKAKPRPRAAAVKR